MKLKMTYDEEVDAAYIHLSDKIKKGIVKNTVESSQNIFLDFDVKNKLIGIEILNVAKTLNKKEIMLLN